jgi:hypothetical protein
LRLLKLPVYIVRGLILVAVAAGIWVVHLLRSQPTPEELLARFSKEMEAKGGKVFQTNWNGQNLAFLQMDCKVYLLDASDRKEVKRTQVLQPGFYLWFTACTGQSMWTEDGYIKASLSNRAIGAGGGNTSGGTYRSKDGRVWEKWTSAKGWLPVEEAQA